MVPPLELPTEAVVLEPVAAVSPADAPEARASPEVDRAASTSPALVPEAMTTGAAGGM